MLSGSRPPTTLKEKISSIPSAKNFILCRDPCGCRRTRLHSPQFLLPQQSTTFFSSRNKHG